MAPNLLSYKYEVYRKIIHILSIVFPITYIFIHNNNYFTIIILALTILLIIIDYFRNTNNLIKIFFNYILSNVVRDYEQDEFLGATYMMLSFSLITFLFPKNIVITSMFILSLSDTIAAIVGIKFKKIILVNNKSLEGTISFILITILILINLNLSLINLVIISIILGLVELLSPTRYDNFTIPLISSILLYIIP